jgi:recombination protein RecA
VGNRVKMKVVKNKVAPPFRTTEFDIMYAEGGVSKSGDVLDKAGELGLVKKSGNTYSYNELKLGVGRENAKRFLRENGKVMNELTKEILKAVKEKEKAE